MSGQSQMGSKLPVRIATQNSSPLLITAAGNIAAAITVAIKTAPTMTANVMNAALLTSKMIVIVMTVVRFAIPCSDK